VRRLSVLLLVGTVIWVSGPTAEAAFPGGNGRIAFDTNARKRSVQVFTILPTGGDRQRLTSRGRNFSPEWSADGSMIVFGHFRNGTQKLETMSVDGSAKSVVLAKPPSGYFDFEDFSWSPDGSQIAFCALSRKFHLDLFVVDSDGTDSTKIAKGACDPSWSPLGGSIAISSYGPNLANRGIDTIAPDGTGRSRVISGKDTYPDWSPDGTTIVYSHRFHPQHDLFLIGADGTGRTRLTSSRRRSEVVAAFSPDGTTIVFSSSPRKPDPRTYLFHYDLFTIAIDGSGRTRLTDTRRINEFAPSWQPV
jgi:Tol biopolymer transport system component